jgi:hypothetical protein
MSPAKKSPRKASKKPARKPSAAARPKPAAKVPAKKAAPKEPPKSKKKAAAPVPAPRKAPEPALERDPALVAAAAQARAEKAVRQKVREARKPAKPRPRTPVVPDIVKPGLGGRWECFRCGAKFYDLNRPEPTCPKCGADQRDKPREKAPAPAAQPERPRRAAVPMGGLLDEEEEPAEEYEGDEEDMGAIDEDAFLTETPEGAEEEEDVDVTALDEE